jgi:1-acyl-sn-glycerol-3-phosphate acyltransferase
MERSWRVFAMGLSFVAFGVGALLVNVLLFCAIAVAYRQRPRRQHAARTSIRISFRSFLWLVRALRIVSLDIDDLTVRELAGARRCIVVANHPTLIDVVVLLAYLEQGNCVVKQALWRNPLLSWVLRMAGYIPNTDAESIVPACGAALERGESLIIFPEATRTVPGVPMRFQRGAASIAVRYGALLKLVRIECDPVMLTKGRAWYDVPERRPRLTVRFRGSVRAHDFLAAGQTVSAAARSLTGHLQGELSRGGCLGARAGTGAEAATD